MIMLHHSVIFEKELDDLTAVILSNTVIVWGLYWTANADAEPRLF
jgi:hypothetical protein